MRLSYRGLPYDYEPPSIDMAEIQLRGNYRGHTLNFAYPRHLPVVQPSLDLQYRGIAYHTTTAGLIQPQIPAFASHASNPSRPSDPLPMRMRKQAIIREVAKVHRTNIRQRLQHRLDVARARGDQGLIAQLEREMHQMA